jgi:hypothetical protein
MSLSTSRHLNFPFLEKRRKAIKCNAYFSTRAADATLASNLQRDRPKYFEAAS